MDKRLLIFIFLPLFFITSKAYAQNSQYYQPPQTRNGTESSKPNFRMPSGTMTNTKDIMTLKNNLNNPKVLEFKSKLSQIKDSRKKQIAEKIDTNISTINTRSTTTMNNALTKMTNILNNIKAKEATVATGGANTAALDASITTATAAITTAQAAVTSQSQKQYTATITDASNSATLKSPFSQMFLQFKTDIMATFQTVLTAKMSVTKAAVELNKLIGGPAPQASSNAAVLR